jgi:hypothetical protein
VLDEPRGARTSGDRSGGRTFSVTKPVEFPDDVIWRLPYEAIHTAVSGETDQPWAGSIGLMAETYPRGQ